MAAIRVAGVVKCFGSVRALDGLELEIPRGSVVGFVGPNGAGKSTTIRVTLGLMRPEEGRVEVLGHPVFPGSPDTTAWRRAVGYLPQDPVFPAQHTALEVLELVGDIHGMAAPHVRARARELLGALQLAEAARRPAAVLSRGMKQRLGLAAALLPEPELLVLDEPVASLDPEGRQYVLELLSRLRGRSTVFVSSHILGDVERIADRVVILHRGRKLADEPMDTLLARYAPPAYRMRVQPVQRAIEALSRLPGVAEVRQPAGERGDGAGILEVVPSAGTMDRIPRDAVPALVQAGVVLLEMAPAAADLEQVFFRVLEERARDERGDRQ